MNKIPSELGAMPVILVDAILGHPISAANPFPTSDAGPAQTISRGVSGAPLFVPRTDGASLASTSRGRRLDSLGVTSAEVVNRESASESGLYFASRMLA